MKMNHNTVRVMNKLEMKKTNQSVDRVMNELEMEIKLIEISMNWKK